MDNNNNNINLVQDIPVETMYDVLSYLNIQDFHSVAKLNKYFYSFTKDHETVVKDNRDVTQIRKQINRIWKHHSVAKFPILGKDIPTIVKIRWLRVRQQLQHFEDKLVSVNDIKPDWLFRYIDCMVPPGPKPLLIEDKDRVIQICLIKDLLELFSRLLQVCGYNIMDDTNKNRPTWPLRTLGFYSFRKYTPITAVVLMMEKQQQSMRIFDNLLNQPNCKLGYLEVDRHTLLSRAVYRGQVQVVQKLLADRKMTPEIINMKVSQNRPALHFSLLNETFKHLVGDSRTDVNARGTYAAEVTPLVRLFTIAMEASLIGDFDQRDLATHRAIFLLENKNVDCVNCETIVSQLRIPKKDHILALIRKMNVNS